MKILRPTDKTVNAALRLFFFVFVLMGCQTKIKTPTDTLVIGLETAPLTLDPRLASDAYSSKITHLLHNGLLRLTERLELLPDLAEKVEKLSPLQYSFHLRSGVLFHDGRPLTAEDVKYTLESIQDPALASPFKGTMDKIREIRILDPLTLEITLREAFSPFLSSLTMGIVPKGGDPQKGTGPFRLESFQPSQQVSLSRNDSYFQTPAKMAHVIFRVVSDDNLRLLELLNRRIDVLQNNIPPNLMTVLKNRKDVIVQKTEGINVSYLGLNLSQEALSRLKVRQALAYALDLPSLITYRMEGLARPATGILAPIHWAYESGVMTHPYDPVKARKLLDEAGYRDPDGAGPASRFTLTYKTSTKKDRIGLARLVARYLKEVGIDVKVLPFEWGTLFHDINTGNFELFSLTWVGITEPDIYYYAFHSSQKPPVGANRGGYSNPEVDRLTEEGRREEETAKRKEIYSSVQKRLAEELPVIPLWCEDNFAVFSNQVRGLRLRPNASFEWAAEVSKELP